MKIEYNQDKRLRTLKERGLDFEYAPLVFEGFHYTGEDDRKDYGERRYITVGTLLDKVVVIVWTPRGDATRIISMRIAHEDEREEYRRELDRPG